MAATTFDTHKAVKTLTKAEVTQPQAEALVAVLVDITDNLVTKDDLHGELANHRSELNGQMNDLDRKMTTHLAAVKLEIAEFKASIFKQLWVMTGSLAGVVVLATLSLIVAMLRLYLQ